MFRNRSHRHVTRYVVAAALAAVALAAIVAAAPAGTAAENRPTNLIAIVTDDQARWAMGLYGNGEIRTPNMDRIGLEGINFVNAFVATPVCSPSRATYLTGLWPSQHGIRDVILIPDAAAGAGLRGLTWPTILQQHGYRTGLIGKWHLGERPEFHPTRHGFHEFTGFVGGGSRPNDALLEVQGKDVQAEGFLTDVLTDHAIAFVRAHRGGPFALSLHYRAPHRPFAPVPDQDAQPYQRLDPTIPGLPGLDREQVKGWTREYYASVASIDRNIGRLLDVLDELGLSRDTIVLFTSDHGYNLGRHYLDTKGNGRWIAGGVSGPIRPNMFDTSLRVPLVVRWPAVIEPGSRSDEMVSHIDVFRTVLGALDIALPSGAAPLGVDLSPIFRGQALGVRDELFGQYDMYQAAIASMRMIRTRRYKLVRHHGTHYLDELYDLSRDPEEQKNVVRESEYAEQVQQLDERLGQWRRQIDDDVVDRNPLWFLEPNER